MTTLFNFFNIFNFFTLTKSVFITWCIILFAVILAEVLAFLYQAILKNQASRFYYGKSPEDEMVKKVALTVSMESEICRIIAVFAGCIGILTIVTFFLANYSLMAGIITEAIVAAGLIVFCILRIIGEYEYIKEMRRKYYIKGGHKNV